MFKRLQKLASSSAALRIGHLKKEAGVAKELGSAALSGVKAVGERTGKAIEKHLKTQVKKHGLIGTALGTAGGLALAGDAPVATSNTYKAYKSGFNPKLHKAELGLD